MAPKSLLLRRRRSETPLYHAVAKEIEVLIEEGTFRPGDRVPSVRALAREWSVSISTVSEAYRVLENRGMIAARPQSGYYVRPRVERLLPEPVAAAGSVCKPAELPVNSLAICLMEDTQRPGMIQLGAAIPHVGLLPVEKLGRTLGSVTRRAKGAGLAYDVVPGNKVLRAEIARRAFQAGCALSPAEVVVTNGCTEAVSLALRALVRPGDAVVVESPFYFGFVQLLEAIGCRVLEIPSCSGEGMSLEALRYALGQHEVKAVLCSPNFSNPTGSQMPEERKRELVELLAARNVPLIEDDIYGDLNHVEGREKAAKAFDVEGNVLLCSSVSKTLAPGWRVGWIAPGRYQREIEALKRQTNLASATPMQMAVAEFLTNGGYDHHLRRLRRQLAGQCDRLRGSVVRHFPEGTRLSHPMGGFVVWVELPGRFDTTAIYPLAREAGVTFTPGALFCSDDRFRHCLRLNAACDPAVMEEGVRRIGEVLARWRGPERAGGR